MQLTKLTKQSGLIVCYRRPKFQIIVKYNVGMLFGVVALTGKQVLAFAPNVQIVIFWLMMVSTVMAATITWVTVNSFCWLNLIVNGLAFWSVNYFLIFNFFVMIGIVTRRLVLKSWWWAAVFWFLLGYLFGLLYAVMVGLMLGWSTGISYWLAGLWFDTVSALSDVLFVILLFRPMLTFFASQHYQRAAYLFNPGFLSHRRDQR